MADFKKSTGKFEANPVFLLETDRSQVDNFIDVMGFALKELQNEPVRKGQLMEIANYAVSTARQLVQVYLSGKSTTGTLERSINAKESHNQIILYADARDPITGYPYGLSFEYGFHPYGRSAFVPARPFLRPALEFAANATRMTFQENVEQLITNLQKNTWNFTHFPVNLNGPNKVATNTAGVRRGYQASKGSLENRFSQVHGLSRKQGSALQNAYNKGVRNRDSNYKPTSSVQTSRYGVKYGQNRPQTYGNTPLTGPKRLIGPKQA